MTTIADAILALDVPVSAQNSNCVLDAQWRLRDALKLAAPYRIDGAAPGYVLKAVADLKSWVDHDLSRKSY